MMATEDQNIIRATTTKQNYSTSCGLELPGLPWWALNALARLAAAVSANVSAGSVALFPAAVAAVARLVECDVLPGGGGSSSTEIQKN